ncbi:MAG TPA: hypothetical protein VF985_00025 [Mariniflexile sp.]
MYPKKTFEGILTNEIYLCPNGKEVLYVYEKNNTSAIYKFKIGSSESKLLIKKEGWNLSEPSFSEDEQKIIYRAWQINNPLISIYVANADGTNSKEIYKDSLLASPKFSKYNSNEVFFIKASEYSSSSPLVREQPKGMSLYSYNLKNKEIKKLTNSIYYSIIDYDFIDENNFVVNSALDGIYRYKQGSFENERLSIEKVSNINPEYINQFYNNPLSYSQVLKRYLLSTFHEVYLWDSESNNLEIKYRCDSGNRIDYASFFKNENKILISTHETVIIIDFHGNTINKFKMPYPRSH